MYWLSTFYKDKKLLITLFLAKKNNFTQTGNAPKINDKKFGYMKKLIVPLRHEIATVKLQTISHWKMHLIKVSKLVLHKY